MTTLDMYTRKSVEKDGECSVCGSVGVLQLWKDRGSSDDPDKQLCGACLLSESEGRFKNISPAEVLREFETIEKSYLTKDNTLCIQTNSALGRFTHVFYLDDSVTVDDIKRNKNEQHVQLRRSKALTGNSEVFTKDGDFVYNPSVYSDIAVQVLEEYA